MVKRIRLGCTKVIEFEFVPIEKKGIDASLLWATGRLFIAGRVVIAGEDGGPVEWTWLDLLEWLARHWDTLLLEQSYPFNVSALGIDTLMHELDQYWKDMPEERIEEEEEQALQFLSRHDLASAFKGIYFPSVYILRLGNTLQVTLAETNKRYGLELNAAIQALEDIAEGIIAQIRPYATASGRAQAAITLWEGRQQRIDQRRLSLLTGLSSECLDRINANCLEFWEFDETKPFAETELMAAARMTSGKLTLDQQKEVFDLLHSVPFVNTPVLDRLSGELKQEFQEKGELYQQGYWAANWLRKKLKIATNEPIQPKEILQTWGVVLRDFELEGSGLDALACWGSKHGPAILINKTMESSAAHQFGKNSTLAHEICHLLLDRGDTLPVAEVLNGNSPERLEKRARAFAAELLLPKKVVLEAVQKTANLQADISKLSDTYQVSERLVSLQIKNSSIYEQLSQKEQKLLTGL